MMVIDRSRVFDVIRSLTQSKEQDFIFVLKTAFLKDSDMWRNCFTVLELMREGPKKLKSDKLDYGNFVLEKRRLSLKKGLNFLKKLEQGKLEVSGYTPRPIKVFGNPEFLGSGRTHWYLRMDRPTRLYRYHVVEDGSINIPGEALVSLSHPLFRDGNEALKTFFGFEVTSSYFNFGNRGDLLVLVPDYRARFKELRIRYTKVSAVVDTGYLDEKDLRIRVFAKAGSESFFSPVLTPKNRRAEFDCKRDLDYVLVYLLSTDGEAIDFKEWHLSWGHSRDKTIIVERPEEQIKDIIRRGEGPSVEFKSGIDNKQDFLETVVAFSNSSGGIMIIGVDNHGNVKGFKGNKEDILKMIHDRCEPPITPKFQIYDDIDGLYIMVLEIEPGENTPYLLKSNGIAYVRHGSNDFPPSRAELDQMYKKEGLTFSA